MIGRPFVADTLARPPYFGGGLGAIGCRPRRVAPCVSGWRVRCRLHGGAAFSVPTARNRAGTARVVYGRFTPERCGREQEAFLLQPRGPFLRA